MHDSSIEKLIEQFEQLPGIGRKSAERIAFYILEQMNKDDVLSMLSAIGEAKENIKFCPVCQNLTVEMPCKICASPKRDKSLICVVESPEDVAAIEATGEFFGVYHVLHGVLSPMDGIGPEDIKINELITRLNGEVKEIIMATNPTVNGTATAVYISKLLEPFDVKVSLDYGNKVLFVKGEVVKE